MDCLDGLKIILIRNKKDFSAFKINEHRSDFNDFTLVLDGQLFYLVNKQPILLEAGDAVYCPIGALLERKESPKVTYLSVNFTTKSGDPLPLPAHIKGALTEEVSAIIKLLSYELKNKSRHSREQIYHLVQLMLIKIVAAEELNYQSDYIIKAKEYIKNNYKGEIGLEDVAKKICLHPSYFSTLFKRSEGKSVTEYITDVRINKAKELLKNTDLTVGKIAEECGMKDRYYFSRVFSHQLGTAPTLYRNLVNNYKNTEYNYYESKDKKEYNYEF